MRNQQPENTRPLIKNGKKLSRRFLGNLFPKNSMETKELKGYIKGHTKFAHGRESDGRKIFYPVRQEYFYI